MSRRKKNEDVKVETHEEFIARGGTVEVIPAVETIHLNKIGSTSKSSPHLMSLAEAEELYGTKHTRTHKKKEPDFSNINISLIPEHLRKFMLNDNNTKDEQDENESD